MNTVTRGLLLQICFSLATMTFSQTINRQLGKFQEVFAWRQLTYNINGNILNQDVYEQPGRISVDNTRDRSKRQADNVYFNNNDNDPERYWNQQNSGFNRPNTNRPWQQRPWTSDGPTVSTPTSRPSTSTVSPADENGRFFIQYNNVPMGVERVGNRLFITVPRRRYGIPSTLNYIDISQESNTLSPALKPYPNLGTANTLTSVYRTRADQCGRLWMVDTGMLEIPNNRQQIQRPAIVIFDLNTDRQILRYSFKDSDIPAENTPTGLASITLDINNGDCENVYAYVPDLTTYGLIVYSLRENDSWRLSHNFFSFNPTAGNLNIAGQRFQWSDGIFSITLGQSNGGCKTAYFHPLVSTQEFSVSTCVLNNRTASTDSNFWSQFSVLGDRGINSQCTMHDYHAQTNVLFFAEVGRDAISCWNAAEVLASTNIVILAQDSQRLSYPSDLHVTGDEVWVMSNSLPRFGYSRLNTDEYNFYIYRGIVQELISGTACERFRTSNNLRG